MFNPDPSLPYGFCENCARSLLTEQDAEEHMSSTAKTVEGYKSHRIRITNPTRRSRICNAVHRETDRFKTYIYDGFDTMIWWISAGHATLAEVEQGLIDNCNSEALEEWKDYYDNNS